MKITEAYHHQGTWYCLPTGKWPERPNHCSQNAPRCEVNGYQHCDCADEEHNYETAISAALKEAKPFEDRVAVNCLVWKRDKKSAEMEIWKPSDGCYPIPPTEVEIVKVMSPGWTPSYNNPDNSGCEQPSEPMEVARIVTPTSDKSNPVEKTRFVKEECDLCDGCGWYEGGPTLITTCGTCSGTGFVLKEEVVKSKLSTEETKIEGYDDADHAWAKVVSKCSFVEQDGVWKVIERLKQQFTITRKS